METAWPSRDDISEQSGGYATICVLGAVAELGLFDHLAVRAMTAAEIATQFELDLRGIRILLDGAVALRYLAKEDGRYRLPEPLVPLLTSGGEATFAPMILHRMNVLRAWSALAWTAKAGFPAPRTSSIRGPAADTAAFVAAMHSASGPLADTVVRRLLPIEFRHLLDVGGASGTWTLAWLAAVPGARATIFDLPHAVAQARERLAASAMADRVECVAGDFYRDPLPAGADLAWVSAIIHQHGREQNRQLFAKVFRALAPGGRIAIRDFVMDDNRTTPADGALFAINMLANTETGDTFTLSELSEDLQAAGFRHPRLALPSVDMNAVVMADKG